MNCVSVNLRGIGKDYKTEWVRRLKIQNDISFLGIQETQLTDVNNINVAGCWDQSDFGYVAMKSEGRSGGLLSMWDSQKYTVVETLKSRHFIITIGNWSGITVSTIFSNIYGPHFPREKKKLWDDLLKIKMEKMGVWIVLGDFNTVRRQDERYNSQFYNSSAYWFNRFRGEAQLHEPRMGGHQYTYFCQTEVKMSKLDRFLICPTLLNYFPATTVTALPREILDHCPILLRTTTEADFGKTPFRFFNSWMNRDGYDEVVSRAWSSFVGYGAPDAYLAAKLKNLKNELKKWRAIDHPKEVMELKTLKLKLQEIDEKIEEQCAVDGDENPRFFHGFVNNRKRKNHINGLVINGSWNTSVEDIRQEVLNFYKDKFKEKWVSRPKFISPKFRKLDLMNIEHQEDPFTLEEIKHAVWSCGKDKALGLDGINFNFIKRHWSIVKGDIFEAIRHFEKYGTISRGCNSSFVTLIPKVNDPIKLGDYRPISLIGCFYKIISKTLANRLKKTIGLNIREEQSAYVEGRNIQDGPMIVNELCSWAKKVKRKILHFKVDFD
ncbi:hypothetical protein Lser_V15G26688 [Lactuca serriola]